MTLPKFNPALGRWAQKIGYNHSKTGKRVEAWSYFAGPESETPPPDVVADSVAKQREWNSIKTEWPELRPALEQLYPDDDWQKPVWFDRDILSTPIDAGEEILEAQKADANYLAKDHVAELKQIEDWGKNQEQIVGYLKAAGLLPKGVQVATRKLTIREAMNEYLTTEEKRLALKVGAAIKVGTHNTDRNNLLLCVGLSIAVEPEEKVKIIDLTKPLVALDNSDIETLAHHWFTLPGNVNSKRTIKNYFAGFRKFVTWCETQDALGFTRPRNMNQVLRIKDGGVSTPAVRPNYALVKSIIENTSERTQMYGLLGLFCGFGQADIYRMEENELEEIDGEYYITGYRAKEDSEAKSNTKIKTTHWIPSELAAMLKKYRAPKNEWGLFFLNRFNRPIFTETLHGGKSNSVATSWDKALEDSRKKLTFKQLRKMGWNEIPKYSTDKVCVGETMSKRWAGQAGGGIGNHYRFQDYEPVIQAQKKWWPVVQKQLGI
jgi:hypothetical protein